MPKLSEESRARAADARLQDFIYRRTVSLLTKPVRDAEIRETIRRVWATFGEAPRKVFVVDSPAAAIELCNRRLARLVSAGSQLFRFLAEDYLSPQEFQAVFSTWPGTCGLSQRLDSRIHSGFFVQLSTQLRLEFPLGVGRPHGISGNFASFARYGLSRFLEAKDEDEPLPSSPLQDRWCETVCFVVPDRCYPIVSRKPRRLRWRGDRLHNFRGYAARWPDGWGFKRVLGKPPDKFLAEALGS